MCSLVSRLDRTESKCCDKPFETKLFLVDSVWYFQYFQTLLQPGIVVAGLSLNEFTITLNAVVFGDGVKSICEDFKPSQTGFDECLSPSLTALRLN